MRIGELAELAGVTVRTVRYYHQAGALPEPARRANGYREYTVDHLATMLRIRQLTGSGLSLAQAGAVVADTVSASADGALDDIDRALEARIAVLTEQRERLAQARAGHHVGLSRLAAALAVKPADVPAATVLAHLYANEPRADLLADALLTPRLRSALVSSQNRFDAIEATSSDGELDELVGEMRRIVAELSDQLPPLPEEKHRLVLALTDRDLNDRQREFLRRLTADTAETVFRDASARTGTEGDDGEL